MQLPSQRPHPTPPPHHAVVLLQFALLPAKDFGAAEGGERTEGLELWLTSMGNIQRTLISLTQVGPALGPALCGCRGCVAYLALCRYSRTPPVPFAIAAPALHQPACLGCPCPCCCCCFPSVRALLLLRRLPGSSALSCAAGAARNALFRGP